MSSEKKKKITKKQKQKPDFMFKPVSPSPESIPNLVNKKLARSLSGFAFSPTYWNKHGTLSFDRYMWMLTMRRRSFFEKKKTIQTHNEDFASMEYLLTSFHDLKKNLKKDWKKKFKKNLSKRKKLTPQWETFKQKFKKRLAASLRQYTLAYFKTFHQENHKTLRNYRLKQYNSKLTEMFFKPWKKIFVPPTARQSLIKARYSRYQSLRPKDRIDFFRTYLGQMMGHMYWGNELRNESNIFQGRLENRRKHYGRLSMTREYFKFRFCHTKSWWYENLIRKTIIPRGVLRHFALDRPQTAFHIYWTQEKLEPWKSSLMFKRALYSGFGEDYRKETKFEVVDIKPYLRTRNPRRDIRNRLYSRGNFLWNNFRQRSRIRGDKFKRLKQVAYKTLSPFYGHLRWRQTQNIVKKSKRIKSPTLTFHETLLSHFENRLDVVVYRLNLAPTILWARRLITSGLIFVTPAANEVQDSSLWESMYSGFKKLAFPLKLRDPKNLYTKTYWTYTQENWVEFKFLGQPQKKISYLLQEGDLVQCAAATTFNHFKVQARLQDKPIPGHLLVKKKKNPRWHFYFQQFKNMKFQSWEQDSKPPRAAYFLHSPQYHELNSKDRTKESFLRWAML